MGLKKEDGGSSDNGKIRRGGKQQNPIKKEMSVRCREKRGGFKEQGWGVGGGIQKKWEMVPKTGFGSKISNREVRGEAKLGRRVGEKTSH